MLTLDSRTFGGGCEIAFYVIFLTLLGALAILTLRRAARWRRDARAPERTVPADVVALRDGRRCRRVTFRMADGDLLELAVPHGDCAGLREGDNGRLTLRGGRYLSFEQPMARD